MNSIDALHPIMFSSSTRHIYWKRVFCCLFFFFFFFFSFHSIFAVVIAFAVAVVVAVVVVQTSTFMNSTKISHQTHTSHSTTRYFTVERLNDSPISLAFYCIILNIMSEFLVFMLLFVFLLNRPNKHSIQTSQCTSMCHAYIFKYNINRTVLKFNR